MKIYMPIDPNGKDTPEMPLHKNLNYDILSGLIPKVYYTGIHDNEANAMLSRSQRAPFSEHWICRRVLLNCDQV